MHSPRRQWWLLLLWAGLLSGESGCVSRRLTIRSDPPGALVEVDGKRIGVTPVSMDFTYYGTREFTLSAPGYETLTVQQPIPTPYYQIFPVDFVSNHFLPFRVTDRHDFTYSLQRRRVRVDDESELINRGRNFRSQAQIGAGY